MPSIQKLARQAYDAFIDAPKSDREAGAPNRYQFNYDTPDWIFEMLTEDADLSLSSPSETEMAVYVLEAIMEASDADLPDCLYELEPDIYTGDLLDWLAEDINNVEYLSNALVEYPDLQDGFKILSLAQLARIEEIAQAIYGRLDERSQDADVVESGDEVEFTHSLSVIEITDDGDPRSLEIVEGVRATVDYLDEDSAVLNLADGTCIRAPLITFRPVVGKDTSDE